VHKWKTEWIEVAEDLVRDEYKRCYEDKEECGRNDVERPDENMVSCGTLATPSTNNVDDLSRPYAECSDFGNYSVNMKATTAETELDDYLKLPVERVQTPSGGGITIAEPIQTFH
jgi:hypothetical protein